MRALIFPALVALSGCATLMNGQLQPISVRTDPPGATCTAGEIAIVSPAQLALPRGSADKIPLECRLAGYRPASVTLKQSGSAWIVGDIFFGLLPGVLVDSLSGGATITNRRA